MPRYRVYLVATMVVDVEADSYQQAEDRGLLQAELSPKFLYQEIADIQSLEA